MLDMDVPMIPLRVAFRLIRPMCVPAHPIHLDALLAWASVQEAERLGREDAFAAQDDLPLEEYRSNGQKVWCASQLLITPQSPPMQMVMTKRFEIDALARAKGKAFSGGPNKLAMGTGPYKAFVINQPIQWTDTVVAYAIGERERVIELLAYIHSIGKQRRNQMGKISTCTVTEDVRANRAWKLRLMPDPMDGYLPIEATIAPPYWDKTRRQRAYQPINIPGDIYV